MENRRGAKPSNNKASTHKESKIKVTTKADGQLAVRSCGAVIFRKLTAEDGKHSFEFLLMKHAHRYDLSKGHQEEGENDIQTAMREVHEETGIPAGQITLADGFSFTETYYPVYKRFGGKEVEKTIRIYAGLATAEGVSLLRLTEHAGCEWIPWRPPHSSIQKKTIDPLVLALEKYFKIHPIDSDQTWSGFKE